MELFSLYLPQSQGVQDMKSFKSRYEIVSPNTDFDENINMFQQALIAKSGEFEESNSCS